MAERIEQTGWGFFLLRMYHPPSRRVAAHFRTADCSLIDTINTFQPNLNERLPTLILFQLPNALIE